VADVTSPSGQEQQQQVESVLKDLDVMDRPRIRVMNKVDLLPEAQRKTLSSAANTVYISAAKNIGLDGLLSAIDSHLEIDALQPLRIRVPQSEGKLLALIESRAHIMKRSYRDEKVQMDLEAPESLVRQLEAYVVKAKRPQVPAQSSRKKK
jgi:GTP-binding protein HflX